MWKSLQYEGDTTDKIVAPVDGVMTIEKPYKLDVSAYVNDVEMPLHHIHLNSGDTVHFKLNKATKHPEYIVTQYNGETHKINVLPGKHHKSSKGDEDNMTTENIFLRDPGMGMGMGAGAGAGLATGLLGGLLGNALFRRGGGWGDGDGGFNTVQTAINDSNILQTLGDIKASVPLAEAQVQLALSGAQNDINANINRGELALTNQLSQQSLALANGLAGVNAAVKDVAVAAERNAWAVTQAINNDGDKTRALIQSIDKTNDSRLITNLANEITELRNEQRLHTATGNININNTNTATAIANQQQQQQQFQILATLNAQLQNLANDVQAVRQGSVVFNSGTMRESGNQSAANTKVG